MLQFLEERITIFSLNNIFSFTTLVIVVAIVIIHAFIIPQPIFGIPPGYTAYFTWRDYPGDPQRGIPAGNYFVPNKEQCLTGCSLWASVGAVAIQFKIDNKNPGLTLNLDPWSSSAIGNCGNCTTSSFSIDCVLNQLKGSGVLRIDPDQQIFYKIGNWREVTNLDFSNVQGLHNILQVGPVISTMCADPAKKLSECASAYLNCFHAVVIIGYRQNTNGKIEVELKNSWPLLEGEWHTTWIEVYPNDECSLNMLRSYQVMNVQATNTLKDDDGDGIKDYIDLCPNIYQTNNSNIDSDYRGDACDLDKDNDLVLNIHDCSPFNRTLAYDLDADSICDARSIRDIYSSHIWITYDSNRCVGECDRLHALSNMVHPIVGFNYQDCVDACTNIDTCASLWESCGRVKECLTQDAGCVDFYCTNPAYCNEITIGGEDYVTPVQADILECKSYCYNPGSAQIDSDGDGRGDFCDTEPMIANLSLSVGTHPGPFGAFERCYDEEYMITFDLWGGRENIMDESLTGEERTDISIDACFCPASAEDWHTSCDPYYCPTRGEYPCNPDCEPYPYCLALCVAGNKAWDPISSPQDCPSPWECIEGTNICSQVDDYDLCWDQEFEFFGYDYENFATRQIYHWRWQQSYDPDIIDEDSGLYAEKDYSNTSDHPGSVKVRVAWTNPGYWERPCEMCPQEWVEEEEIRVFLENAQEMKSGCVIIGLDLDNAFIQGSQWLLQTKAFDRFREFIPPNEPVSQVFNDIIKGEAFGLFNDPVTGESFVVTIRRDDASIMNWAKINLFGKDQTLGSKPSYTKAVIGFMDTQGMGEIGKIINPQGADRIPVVFHLEGDKLWYGFIAHEKNLWISSVVSDYLASIPIDFEPDGAEMIFDWKSGTLLLLSLTNGNRWSLKLLKNGRWIPSSTELIVKNLPSNLEGHRLVTDYKGAIYIVGGVAPSPLTHWVPPWTAIHQLNLETMEVESLTEVYGTEIVGAFAEDEIIGAVSPKGMVTIFNTVTRKTDTRMAIMPDEIGRGSYLSYNPRNHILSIISSGKSPALQRYSLVGSSGEKITTEIKLNIGWNMVSLPVKPLNPTASVLFPGVRVIYGFNEETGYVRITNNETLEVGNGYWILLEEAKKFILTGQFINEYSFEVDEAEWQMIGGCTLPALASIESGNSDIVVIYGYSAGSGYQRVREEENLEPGKGYWLSISGPAKVTIKSIID